MKSKQEMITKSERDELLKQLLNERFIDATRERFQIQENETQPE
jgi:hypothetical protein